MSAKHLTWLSPTVCLVLAVIAWLETIPLNYVVSIAMLFAGFFLYSFFNALSLLEQAAASSRRAGTPAQDESS